MPYDLKDSPDILLMADVAHEASPEFWQPPILAESHPAIELLVPATMAEVCPRCATEYLLGSRFCHTCGSRRPEAISATARADAAEMAGLWERAVAKTGSIVKGFSPVKIWQGRIWLRKSWEKIEFPAWLRYLHFHEIQRWIGLPTASMIAFVIGLCCVAGALVVGLITAKTLVEWQAIQLYRAEWLLAATAAFVAGILLKKPSNPDSD